MTEATEGKDQKSFEELLHTDPDSLPEDPDALAALIERDSATENPADAADPDAEAKAKADADAKAKADADADAKAKAKAEAAKGREQKPDGVTLKDGKTVIPYHVLEATRRREDAERHAREEAEAARKTAEERANTLQDEVDALKRGEGGKPDTQATEALREKIAALKEQVPEVGEVLDAMTAQLNATSEELARLREERDAERERQETAARDAVQQVIDANPVLRYWQNENVELYNEAARLDQQLRQSPNPDVRALSMEQRFEKVVEMIETLHGKTELPEGYRPKADPSKTTDPNPKKPGQDVQADPKEKKPEKPITLSDLPGGVPPNTRKSTDEMTTTDLDAEIRRMQDKGLSPMDILAALDLPGD